MTSEITQGFSQSQAVVPFSQSHLAGVESLVPRRDPATKKMTLPPHYVQRAVTVVGIKTTVGRFLPVSHEGESNETYVDKVELLGATRAEFIARKLKGIERRMHMRLFRELTETHKGGDWQMQFKEWFDKRACEIPNELCTLCWNDSLFGSLEAGKGATFSRARYFDSYSVEHATDCIAQLGSEEGMAIGNTVGENLSKGRGDASLHYYQYVKPGTHFPFITVIENPTLLDIAGLLHAITAADARGYGKYSANHGKFHTEVLAVSTGLPRFSVLDMLQWADESGVNEDAVAGIRRRFDGAVDGARAPFEDGLGSAAETLWGAQSEVLRRALPHEFTAYAAQLDARR
jgi:CRISPR type I-D-associated protein Csc2